ncbi:hypothetical protein [Streptomyces sp. NPDC005989]|uniref:hypothetical protein n=1 Tax=Streptomyces sp. NPDC005989 TaxID=3156727 RepID=UPI00340E4A55
MDLEAGRDFLVELDEELLELLGAVAVVQGDEVRIRRQQRRLGVVRRKWISSVRRRFRSRWEIQNGAVIDGDQDRIGAAKPQYHSRNSSGPVASAGTVGLHPYADHQSQISLPP